jgi:hypothetical protein
MRPVPVVLTVLAFGVQFTVGRIEARLKQEEIDGQRTKLDRIADNVEALVASGKLSPEDAKRLLVKL